MGSRTPSKAFSAATSARNLEQIYRTHVRDGLARGRDGISPDALEHEIKQTAQVLTCRLRSGTYRFTHYRELLASKGAGKCPRIISIPTARDRVTMRALADFLGEVYPHAKGVIAQKRVRDVTRALESTRFDSYVRLDVRDFYPTILHDRVEYALKRRIRKPEIINVIMKAIQTPTVNDRSSTKFANTVGVPQGLAISNMLSELVVAPIDVALSGDSRCEYFRFVDDVLILYSAPDGEALADKATALFQEQGLLVHPITKSGGKSRSGLIVDGFDYLGYNFSDRRISVRPSSVHKLESSLARIFTRYKKVQPENREAALRICQWRVNLVITGCIYENNPYGWLQYFRQMNDRKLLKQLDATVLRFQKRFQMPENFQAKSFMRAHWAILHPHGKDSSYIPNLDNLNVNQMRDILSAFLGEKEVSELSDKALSRVFKRVMRNVTAELERDIRPTS